MVEQALMGLMDLLDKALDLREGAFNHQELTYFILVEAYFIQEEIAIPKAEHFNIQPNLNQLIQL